MKKTVYIAPSGSEYTPLLYAVSLRNGWEWYGFEDEGDGIYFGFVHGFEDEWGSFTLSELKSINATIVTTPAQLASVAPPVGWTRKEEGTI